MFQKLKHLNTNWYFKLIARLVLAMLFYSILRIIFFTLNRDLFEQVTFVDYMRMALGGLKFDLVAMLYTNALFIILCIIPFKFRYNKAYQKTLEWIFIVCNSIALLANCADIAYFRFTLRRTTFNVFKEFQNETQGFKLLGHFILTYWYIAVVFVLAIYAMKKLYGGLVPKPAKFVKPYFYYSKGVILLAVFSGLFVAGVRGGFRHSTRPITLSNSGDYTKNPLEVNIVLNTPFTLLKTIEIVDLKRETSFTNEKVLENHYNPVRTSPANGAFKPMNVVIMILESNGKEYYGFYNKDIKPAYKGYTPFMDSLINQSLTFKYSYASGQKSIDAMPSILCSIPYMVEPFITTRYATNNNINSIASLLKPKGYYSAYFHGAPNGSMGFQAFANLTGYDAYFGKTEYNNNADFDNIWGIWDEEFFQFYARKMGTFKQPFMTTIFSVSSHDPFKVPKRYKGKFPKGNVPIHQCIGYTDMALRKFFKTASKMPWFKNTLFVITADHTNQKYLEKYKTDLNHFAVPIIFYTPGGQIKKEYNQTDIVQQADIMPSILGFLNYDKPYFSFGFDTFHRPSDKYIVVNYKNGFYQLLKDKYLLRFDGQKAVSMFDFKNDEKLSTNLLTTNKALADSLTLDVKAFIQQYNNRMLDNRLLPNR